MKEADKNHCCIENSQEYSSIQKGIINKEYHVVRLKKWEREKGREENKIKDGGITPKTLTKKKKLSFLHKYGEKMTTVFKVALKIGILKYIQGHKYLKTSYFFLWWQFRKKNNFLDSRGHRVFLILKSYIHKLSKSTMGCHVPDANLKATLNFPDPAHSIWMNFGLLCFNSEGCYQWHFLKLPISYVAVKKCIFQSSGSRLHKGQQCTKLSGVEIWIAYT